MNDDSILSSYLNQQLTGPVGAPLPDPSYWVVGTAVPEEMTWEQAHEIQRLLMHWLADERYSLHQAYALSPARSWVEPVVVAIGADPGDVFDAAERANQDYVVRRTADATLVLDRDSTVLARGPLAPAATSTGGCLMEAGSLTEVCQMKGSFYTSQGRRAALQWQWQRERLITALGCTTCDMGTYVNTSPGAGVVSGGLIPGIPHVIPTRFTKESADV